MNSSLSGFKWRDDTWALWYVHSSFSRWKQVTLSFVFMYLFCRLKPTSFWWLTAQLMRSCWCLRGWQDRHTTAYVSGGITAPPPLSASASTSKRRSFNKKAVKPWIWDIKLVDYTVFLFFLLCSHSLEQKNWHVGANVD